MKTEILTGKVIYSFLSSDNVDINFLLENGDKKGFVVTAVYHSAKKLLRRFFQRIEKGDVLSLTLLNGQIRKIVFHRNGDILFLDQYPQIGAVMKESPFRHFSAIFVDGKIDSKDENACLYLDVAGAEQTSYCLVGKEKVRFQNFLKKCCTKDVLRFFQNPEGIITKVVNKTRAFEFAC